MKLGLIGAGAIARYVGEALIERGHVVEAVLLRPEKIRKMQTGDGDGPCYVASVSELPRDIDHVVECAGHQALREFGAAVLGAGFDMTTLSIGALADQALADDLAGAAHKGNAKLHLASGAIGALDCLRAANIGALQSVRYSGRKPPEGWRGSPAETKIDLSDLGGEPHTHFAGTARRAALEYPKNANVAAAVAIAGLGFDDTQVELIADPTISANIHELHAVGEFGEFEFRIAGSALSDNPRSSALAAMSAVSCVLESSKQIGF